MILCYDKGLDTSMTAVFASEPQPISSSPQLAREDEPRRRWMAALALAPLDDLETAWSKLPNNPDYLRLRGPEMGLIMVRGRTGGTGAAFNLGEMTITRCTVQVDDALVGHAYIAGTEARHAELAAVFDALMQDPARRAALEDSLVTPLLHKRETRLRGESARIASSKVEFFTVVRGENER